MIRASSHADRACYEGSRAALLRAGLAMPYMFPARAATKSSAQFAKAQPGAAFPWMMRALDPQRRRWELTYWHGAFDAEDHEAVIEQAKLLTGACAVLLRWSEGGMRWNVEAEAEALKDFTTPNEARRLATLEPAGLCRQVYRIGLRLVRDIEAIPALEGQLITVRMVTNLAGAAADLLEAVTAHGADSDEVEEAVEAIAARLRIQPTIAEVLSELYGKGGFYAWSIWRRAEEEVERVKQCDARSVCWCTPRSPR